MQNENAADREFHRGGPVPRLDRYTEIEIAIQLSNDERWRRLLSRILELLPTLEEDDSRMGAFLLRMVEGGSDDPELVANLFDDMIGAADELNQFVELLRVLAELEDQDVPGFRPMRLLSGNIRELVSELVELSLAARAREFSSKLELAEIIDDELMRAEYTSMRETFVETRDAAPIVEVLWRGDAHQVRPTHWIARRKDGSTELLAPTGTGWHIVEGRIEELIQCLPEPLFAHAIKRLAPVDPQEKM